MADEGGNARVALIVTCRRELGKELSRALEETGYGVRMASGFEHLDLCADVRPLLVLADLALTPTSSQWHALNLHFPDSIVWALVERGAFRREVVAAAREGCQGYLVFPIGDGELQRRLQELDRLRESGVGGACLDEYMSTEIRLRIPSDRALVERVVRHVASRCRDYRGYRARTLMNLRVALCETLSNAIIYGNRDDPTRSVRIEASVDASSIRVTVTDEGDGFSLTELPDPTGPEALASPCGRGLFLLHKLADHVKFNERRNSVTFVIRSDSDRS